MLLHRTRSTQLNPINANASHSSPAHVNPVGLDWIELEWIGFDWILFDSIVLTWIAHYIGHNISQHTDKLVECTLLLSKPLRSTMWFSAVPAHFTTRSRTMAGIHREWPSAFLRRDALDRLRVATARVRKARLLHRGHGCHAFVKHLHQRQDHHGQRFDLRVQG